MKWALYLLVAGAAISGVMAIASAQSMDKMAMDKMAMDKMAVDKATTTRAQ